MQLLSVGLARSIWLFDMNQLNPGGKSIFPDSLIWLGEKYSFQTFPKALADLDKEKKGFLFTAGEFHADSGPITVNLSIYNDGLVAETWASTEKGDSFLEDALRSVSGRHGLVIPPVMRKQYVSELTIKLDNPIPSSNDPLIEAFCRKLDRLFESHGLPPFEFNGMGFSVDASRSSYKPPGLSIERKLGVDFSLNQYWSKSAFQTKDHLFALEEFEKLIAAMNSRLAAASPMPVPKAWGT